MNKNRTIKPPANRGSGIRPSIDTAKLINSHPIFSFEYFCGKSISINKSFNNFYKNEHSAAMTVGTFFVRLKELSKHPISELTHLSSLHYHPIRDTKEVSIIEEVLKEYGSIDEETIKNFEQAYVQFSIYDGGRIICHKNDYTFYVLFPDPGHLIYSNTSRDFVNKLSYKIPGYFCMEDVYGRKSNHDKIELLKDLYKDKNSYSDMEQVWEYINMIIEEN